MVTSGIRGGPDRAIARQDWEQSGWYPCPTRCVPEPRTTMRQKELSKLEAILTPAQLDFRLEVAAWLNKYPWTHLWTPTFGRREQQGRPQLSRAGNYCPKHGWSGGGTFKPDYSFSEETKLHVSGFTDAAAIRATKRFIQKFMSDYSWFFVAEKNPGRDGHHVHCLLIPPAGKRINVPRLGNLWWKKYGWNKFEKVRGKSDVTSYCTKHVCEYLNKGDGWYEIEINDSELYHNATRTGS